MKIRPTKALWKVTELWKKQRTLFPQLLEPSVHNFHNADCCCYYIFFRHNIPSTPRRVRGEVRGVVMKSSRRQESRAAKRKVEWGKESPADAWCRSGSVDNDEQAVRC